MALEASRVDQISEMMLYDYFVLWFCGLYRWVDCGEDPCNIEDAEQRILDISKICNVNLKQINNIAPGCQYDGIVERIQKKRHIRYPFINHDFYWNDMKIPIKIRIRINPCVDTKNESTYNGKHSKIWVIIQNIEPLPLTGDDLAGLFISLEYFAMQLEEFVAKSYVNIIEDAKQRDRKRIIKMRTASIKVSDSIPDFQTVFIGLKEPSLALDKLQSDAALLQSSKDVYIFSENLIRLGFTPGIEQLANGLAGLEDHKRWRVGGDFDTSVSYIINEPSSTVFSVGGIVRSEDESSKMIDLYHTFQRMAINISWRE